jgi:hypothetical protein
VASESYCQLTQLNNIRAPAVPIVKEKLTYASKLESRDEIAFKIDTKKRQEIYIKVNDTTNNNAEISKII